MTQVRCPTCGGLVTDDAEWCGQCFTRFGPGGPTAPEQTTEKREASARVTSEPQATRPRRAAVAPPGAGAPASQAPGGTHGSFRRTEAGLVWACPTCEMENPLEASACTRCGTRFEQVFADEGPRAPKQAVDPSTARGRSLFFPGLGHAAAGKGVEGVARAVMFLWVLVSGIALLLLAGRSGTTALTLLGVLYVAAAIGLYTASAIDAGRAAEGTAPILGPRPLLYGAGVLIVLTILSIFLLGTRAAT